jgi:type II secretory pathway component PulF
MNYGVFKMVEFLYKGYNKKGKEVSGTIEALDRNLALEKLETRDIHPFNLTEKGEVKNKPGVNQVKNRSGELILFTRQLGSLLRAGIQLGEALELISRMLKPGSFRDVVIELHNSLRAGKGFAEALKNFPQYFSPTYISMVKAGEESGFLGATCQRLASNLEEKKKLRSYIISSLFYPLVLLVTALMAIIVMLTFVLPKFVAIYDSYNRSLPWITELLLLCSRFLGRYGLFILLAFILFLLVFYLYSQSEEGRSRIDELLLGTPLLGKLLTEIEVYRVTGALGTMLKNGVPLSRALEIVKNVTGNIHFQQALQTTGLRVNRGGYLSEALASTGVFPELVGYLVGVGEQTGKMAEMLLEIADYYQEEYRTGLERMMKLFEPFLLLFMGVLIGIIVIAMLLPVLGVGNIPI